MTEKENRLVTGRIAPALLQFALPFMAASFLQAIYGAVDLFVVGQYDDGFPEYRRRAGGPRPQFDEVGNYLFTGLRMCDLSAQSVDSRFAGRYLYG